MPPRIDPTKVVKHNHHLDEHWPGVVHSTWTLFGKLKLRRERTYTEPTNRNLRAVAYQLWLAGGDSTGGVRIERRSPRTRHW